MRKKGSVQDGKALTYGEAVRRAVVADVDRLVALEAVSFGQPWDAASLAASLELGRGAGWVIEASGEPLPGAEAWTRTADAPVAQRPEVCGYALFLLLPGEAELLRVAVVPERRGRGLARRLLEVALGELAAGGRPRCFLEVRAANRAAVSLYERLGFRLSGRRNRYYADGEDALLFRCDAAARGSAPGPSGSPAAG